MEYTSVLQLNLSEDFSDVEFPDLETSAALGFNYCCNAKNQDEGNTL
jgi:hypothetical protein